MTGEVDPLLMPCTDLKYAVAEAKELIAFLSTEGRLPEKIVTREFLELLDNECEKHLKPPEELKFWFGFSKLAEEAHPTHAEGLMFRNFVFGKKIQGINTDQFEHQRRKIFFIRLTTWVSFFTTLVLLMYLSFTEGIMTRNHQLDAEYRLMDSGVLENTRIEHLIPMQQQVEEVQEKRRIQQQVDNLDDQQQQVDDLDNAQEQVDHLDSAVFQDEVISNIEIDFLDQRYSALGEVSNLIQNNDRMLARMHPLEFIETPDYSEYSQKNLTIESIQQSINQMLSIYILPVFTSLLGVAVYILRKTSKELKEGSYKFYESGTYSFRISLGVVGGIVISWFTINDPTKVVASITPAALAFLVGYSIEVLYNVLDSLVGALGAKQDVSAKS